MERGLNIRTPVRAGGVLWLMAALLSGQPVHAEDEPPWQRLDPGPSAHVAAVIDGDTLRLKQAVDGASEVRLVGIQAPKLPLGRKGFEAWPLAREAKAALETLVLGRAVELFYAGRRKDRHGRHLAHVRGPRGTWLQGRLVEAGWARVRSFADNRVAIPMLLEHEVAARRAGRGIWGHAYYAVRTPEEAEAFIGRFEVVEGTVVDAATVNGRTYLNFGADWRTDFTGVIGTPGRRLYRDDGIDPEAYAGRSVRLRGWLESLNGPMIRITHPEQVEMLD